MFELLRNRNKEERQAPKYGLLYFDHLTGEYSLLTNSLSDEDKQKCTELQDERKKGILKWDDIYAYQLIFLKSLDLETLKSKIVSLRIKYQSLVDPTEYANYSTLRAVDLTKTLGTQDIESLRADYKYLLDEFYLRYAYISTREEFRTTLLRYGTVMTVVFFIIAASIALMALVTKDAYLIRMSSFSSTIFMVAFAGITGAFVSVQQRFQNVSNQGDPIYNLALLTHGWLSLILSPLSGAIFAVILYLFFVSGLLTGSIFPVISTIDKPVSDVEISVEVEPETPASTNSNSSNSNSPEGQTNTSTTSSGAQGKIVQPQILGLTKFLPNTGPKTGKDLALLLIWSFIAGFAERFVPDTLMRLVNQKKGNEGSAT